MASKKRYKLPHYDLDTKWVTEFHVKKGWIMFEWYIFMQIFKMNTLRMII